MLNESFAYHDGSLHCDRIPLNTIADEIGTPVYVYSATRIQHNVDGLRAAFAPLDAAIHYSLKANANLSLIRLLHAMHLGMDAVSAGEVYRALQAKVDPAQIVFAGVGKTRHELVYALDQHIGWFNVESQAELELLNTLAEAYDYTPTVALRLNPGIQAQTHRHIATGHTAAKFGMDADTVAAILAKQARYRQVQIAGIHVHIGSQLGRAAETVSAVEIAQDIARPYPDVRTLNIGGGFPVRYTQTDEYPAPQAFADALAPLVEGWHIKIEPGRSIIADAGVLVIAVLYTKQQGEHHVAITDGSMTELLRPALYGAEHPVVPLHMTTANERETVVAGPVCESADILHHHASLPPLKPGDRLAVLATGAYGMTMASNYNARPRPPEVLVDTRNPDGAWRVIRRRESWDDMLRLEE